MTAFEYIIGAILIIFALLIIVVVLFQEGRQANLGVISGAADSFMDKNMAKTWDARLAKITKFIAIAFFVLVLAGMLVTRFLGPKVSSSNNNGATTSSTTTSATTTTTTAATTTTTTAK